MNIEFGLIGNPLGHSFSPEIHQALADYDYQLFPMDEEKLEQLLTEKTFKGLNVTIPYKEKVIDYLDEIDPYAEKIGAVNTIVNENGHLKGYNTDILGMRDLLASNQIDIYQQKVLILGTGGTSKTAKVLCEELEAKEIILVSRQASVEFCSYEQVSQLHHDADIILNTTPCGLAPSGIGQSPISLAHFPQLRAVVDVLYNPLRTQFIIEAEKRGLKTCNGLYMLIMQALYAAELFTGTKIDVSKADYILRQMTEQKQNIVLIGMPSSGKTTIGEILSETLNRPFLDIDALIEEKEQASPAQIISQKGEPYFRKIEAQIIQEICPLSNQVIATGGGSILNEQNVDLLKANGLLFFIDRPLENLTPTSSRPLSSTQDALDKKYKERYPIYQKTADYKIEAKDSPENIANAIIKQFFHQ